MTSNGMDRLSHTSRIRSCRGSSDSSSSIPRTSGMATAGRTTIEEALVPIYLLHRFQIGLAQFLHIK